MSESSERARRATGLFSFVRMFERVGGMKSIGVRGARAMGNSRIRPPSTRSHPGGVAGWWWGWGLPGREQGCGESLRRIGATDGCQGADE